MRNFLLILLINISVGFSQKITVGLYNEHVVKSIDISIQKGSYLFFTDSTLLGDFSTTGNPLRVEASENGLYISCNNQFYSCTTFKIIPNKFSSFFQIKPSKPELKGRLYEGELHIELTKKNNLKMFMRYNYNKPLANMYSAI